MIITKEWLNKHKTANGAWTKQQIKCLAISWPPSKGWMKRLDGAYIDLFNKKEFERLAGKPAITRTLDSQAREIARLNKKIVELQAIIDKY